MRRGICSFPGIQELQIPRFARDDNDLVFSRQLGATGTRNHRGFTRIVFRTPTGNVSHAVRSTSLGARSRMLIK
jgi:hypothetical protein